MKNPVRLLLHVPVPWVFVLSYLLGVCLEYAFPTDVPSSWSGASTAAGGVLFAVGAVMAGWSLLIFRRNRTTTVPGRTSTRLVTWGPYRFSRNPMYVGLVCAYLGEAGLLKQPWPIALLPLTIAYLNGIVIPVEEGRLREAFGGSYEAYRASVRRWL